MTDLPCACGTLETAADDPRRGIVYDAETGEYQLRYVGADGRGEGRIVLYHCPFCGGTAPASKRHLLFAVITAEEEARLAAILNGVTTIAKALDVLGKAGRDGRPSPFWQSESEGQPPAVTRYRTLVYTGLSKTADVGIREREDGSVHWFLQGKYVGGAAK